MWCFRVGWREQWSVYGRFGVGMTVIVVWWSGGSSVQWDSLDTWWEFRRMISWRECMRERLREEVSWADWLWSGSRGWLHIGARELGVAGLSVLLRGRARTGREWDTSATSTPQREVLMREEGTGDVDKWTFLSEPSILQSTRGEGLLVNPQSPTLFNVTKMKL